MRLLTLIRHAKSSWKNADLADIDRPLNSRGKTDAPVMGRRLNAIGFDPDLMLSSPAKRARRTARAILRELSAAPAFAIDPTLYMADPLEMLELIRALGGSIDHAALVGHNPGMTELANLLTGAAIDNVPTAGVVRMALDIDDWTQTSPGGARLLEFDYPKNRPSAD